MRWGLTQVLGNSGGSFEGIRRTAVARVDGGYRAIRSATGYGWTATARCPHQQPGAADCVRVH